MPILDPRERTRSARRCRRRSAFSFYVEHVRLESEKTRCPAAGAPDLSEKAEGPLSLFPSAAINTQHDMRLLVARPSLGHDFVELPELASQTYHTSSPCTSLASGREGPVPE
eukprot:6556201-Pyramimonas_sp.AAC.1